MAISETRRLLLRYRVISVLILVLGIALSTLAFVAADSRERGTLHAVFDDAAVAVQSGIMLALQRSNYLTDSVGALFDSTNNTPHAQFDIYTKRLLMHMRGVQAVEWIPLVPSARRNSFEKAAHLQAKDINAAIYDDSAPTSERVLANWPAVTREQASLTGQTQAKSEFERIESLNVGERRWTVVLTPSMEFYRAHASRPTWIVLVVGLLFSALLLGYIEAARKHLREELKSHEARLAAEEKLTDILGSIDSVVMSIFPATGELLYANRAAVGIFGRSSTELSKNKRQWFEAFPPDDQERILRKLSLALEKESWSDVFRIGQPSGEVRWIAGRAKAVHDAAGNVARIDVVASDITEQRLAQEVIKQLSHKTELILNSVGEGIFGLDLEGKTTFVNPAAVKLLGWPAEELLDKPIHSVIHHTKPDGTPYPDEDCPNYKSFRDGTVNHRDNEVFWRKDGTSFAVDYTSTPIVDDNNSLMGAVVVFKDITERKRAEQNLRAAEEQFRGLVEQSIAGIYIIQDEKIGLC